MEHEFFADYIDEFRDFWESVDVRIELEPFIINFLNKISTIFNLEISIKIINNIKDR